LIFMNFARWDNIAYDFTKDAICHRNYQYKIIFIELKYIRRFIKYAKRSYIQKTSKTQLILIKFLLEFTLGDKKFPQFDLDNGN